MQSRFAASFQARAVRRCEFARHPPSWQELPSYFQSSFVKNATSTRQITTGCSLLIVCARWAAIVVLDNWIGSCEEREGFRLLTEQSVSC
jgi:hypothetical protein